MKTKWINRFLPQIVQQAILSFNNGIDVVVNGWIERLNRVRICNLRNSQQAC